MDPILIACWGYTIGVWTSLYLRKKKGWINQESFARHILNTVFWPLGLIIFCVATPLKMHKLSGRDPQLAVDDLARAHRTQDLEREARNQSIAFWRESLTSDNVVEQNLAKDMLAQYFEVGEVDEVPPPTPVIAAPPAPLPTDAGSRAKALQYDWPMRIADRLVQEITVELNQDPHGRNPGRQAFLREQLAIATITPYHKIPGMYSTRATGMSPAEGAVGRRVYWIKLDMGLSTGSDRSWEQEEAVPTPTVLPVPPIPLGTARCPQCFGRGTATITVGRTMPEVCVACNGLGYWNARVRQGDC
jgi:hypothetical protein